MHMSNRYLTRVENPDRPCVQMWKDCDFRTYIDASDHDEDRIAIRPEGTILHISNHSPEELAAVLAIVGYVPAPKP